MADWLATRATLSPQRVALIDAQTRRRVSYQRFDAGANQAAHRLLELGISSGERVGVISRNRIEVLELLFACARVRAVFAGLNWRLAGPELAAQVAACQPTLVLYEAEFAEQASALGVRAVSLESALSGLDALPTTSPSGEGAGEDDPWVLCFTGGSTGRAKAAVLTRRSLTANALSTIAGWGLSQDDVAILDAPLFHTGGLNVLTTPLIVAGGTSIVCSQYDPGTVLGLIEEGLPTVLFGVPTMLLMLTEHPFWGSADLSGIRLAITGGAPAPGVLYDRFGDKGVALRLGYGLTEAGPNNFWMAADEAKHKRGAVGYPLFNIEARLADGELLLRGPHLMAGYFNAPDATAAAVDAEGWLHTGDMARCDADGAYTIVGRKKDMFISGGENVYPAEIEDVLHRHPAVVEAAVLGVPHARWGEVGAAAVVWRGAAVDLSAYLGERLARYKVPQFWTAFEALPRTAAGKVDRLQVRSLLTGGDE